MEEKHLTSYPSIDKHFTSTDSAKCFSNFRGNPSLLIIVPAEDEDKIFRRSA